MRYTITAAALVGAAFASLPTTIDPCPAAPTPLPAITVTEQYQTVSFCVPTTTCSDSTCSTAYPLASTSVYVSTVIPCKVSGTSASSCTITTTDQVVPCSVSTSVITMVTPMPFTYMEGNMTKTGTSYSTNYATTSMEWDSPYNKVGPLAIPGYGGSGLCTDCDKDADGNRNQFYSINQCYASQGSSAVCHNYPFTFVSTQAPSATSQASAVVSSHAAVNQPGTYTYTFPQVAPAYTMTSNGQTYTVPPQPWYAHATQTAKGPTTFDFTVTITHLITYYKPQPQTPPPSKQTQWSDWGNWKPTTTTTPTKPTTSSGSWSAWQPISPSFSSSMTLPMSTTTTTVSSAVTTTTTSTLSPTITTTTTTTTTVTIGNTITTTTPPSEVSPAPGVPQFNIKIVQNAQKRFRKRSDVKYIGFSGEDGHIVDEDSAASFWFDSNQNLRSGTSYIETDGNGYVTFELTDTPPSTDAHKFSGSPGGGVSLSGASFCVAGDNVIISFTSAPSGCIPAQLSEVSVDATTSTTSTTTTTSVPTTTSAPATTTTTSPSITAPTTVANPISTTTSEDPEPTPTADPSADLDAPEPTGPSKRHAKRGVIRGMSY